MFCRKKNIRFSKFDAHWHPDSQWHGLSGRKELHSQGFVSHECVDGKKML
jgi:hypothetical protein